MAELVFYAGTMDCGKSTLALQTDHNHSSRGRAGIVFTRLDRAGESMLSSRLGLAVPAIEVGDDFDFRRFVVDELSTGMRIDYLICDEAQFYTQAQVEQLARLVDELAVDVPSESSQTFGPDSSRDRNASLRLADRMQVLQVEALCWCGTRAIHNARTLDGEMTTEGDQVLVGDVSSANGEPGTIAYEVLRAPLPRRIDRPEGWSGTHIATAASVRGVTEGPLAATRYLSLHRTGSRPNSERSPDPACSSCASPAWAPRRLRE